MKKKKNKLSKQAEQEQNQRYIEVIWRVISWERKEGEWEEMVQGQRSITGRYNTDRGRLRIV